MSKKKNKNNEEHIITVPEIPLLWLKAAYTFHTYAYRDPRAAFSSATGSPVVSPTTVLLGIVSTLFSLGKENEANSFIAVAHFCKVIVDTPDGIIFFKAFHQLRRYETDKYDKQNPRIGLTNINQGTREYGLVDGQTAIFVGIPEDHKDAARLALVNLMHLGTHDSMCSLVGSVEPCSEPKDIVYIVPEEWKYRMAANSTFVTLSRFKNTEIKPKFPHWLLAGDADNTEIVPYLIKGRFEGTSRGKIFKKY